jgi:pyridinium-3,5-biscarboxylic acid mononucleotide sulfurtransferase
LYGWLCHHTAVPASTDPRPLIRRLERRIRSYDAAVALVAFSGGVDSAATLALACRALGTGAVTAVTAVSPSYPSGELEGARAVAASLGVAHRVIETGEVGREAYARNDAWRCFHCKTELYATLRRLARRSRGAAVLAGANADDAHDVRPGLLAAREQGVRNPLLEEGVGKEAVRAVARRLGLVVADKPALACLSSRVAHGIRVTPDLLGRIDLAERAVRALGFDPVRVRHFGRAAVIEVAPELASSLAAHPGLPGLAASLRDLGWDRVTVDPEGFRSGRMNATLPLVPLAKRPRDAGSSIPVTRRNGRNP